jgi:hypothetical protein
MGKSSKTKMNSYSSTTETPSRPGVDDGHHNNAHNKLKQPISKKARKLKVPKKSSITMINSFASTTETPSRPGVDEGRHNNAHNELQRPISNKARTLKVPKNPQDRRKPKRANIITEYFDVRMQASIDKPRAIYYKDPKGIDMTYPQHVSKVMDLSTLKILEDNSHDNNFNVVIGCKPTNENESTFIVLKVSENQRIITPGKMKNFNKALQGLLKNKPSVIRGSKRNGVTQQYVCHGFRKNPEDRDISEYAFSAGVSDIDKRIISEGVKDLVGAIERPAIAELMAANLGKCAGLHDFVKAKIEYSFPSVNDEGHATQVALSIRYCSRVHTDKDFFLTTLSCYDEKAGPDEILYHFCFPTYGIAVPMRSGDIIIFNPLVPHCATNPRSKTAMIYSCYVSNKTCNTIVANAMDKSK